MFPSVYPPVPRFGVAFWAIVVASLVFLVVGAWRGRRAYRRLLASRDANPRALVGFYRRNIARKCLWLLPVVAVLFVPGVRPVHLGLVWPYGPYAALTWGTLVYLALVVLVSGLVWRWRAQRGRSVLGQRAFRALVPRTAEERRWAAVVAVCAGVCEEALARGLMLCAARSAGLSVSAALLATALLFGLLHVYQGVWGVLGTTLAGLLFAGLFVETGSLAVPVLLHILVDVRALLVVPTPAVRPDPPAVTAPPPAYTPPRAGGVPRIRNAAPEGPTE